MTASRPTVLLVDDEPQILQGLRLALRREPFRVLTADSGAAGLEVLQTEPVDVIVSDQDMPGMSGTQFLEKAAVGFPDTVRIMLTGQPRLQVAIDAINDGQVYRFFTKPCDGWMLAATMRDALAIRRLTEKSSELLRVARMRQQELDELERHNPGITKVAFGASGAIEMRAPTEDLETLLAEIDAETRRSRQQR